MKPIANQLHPLQNQVEFLGIHDARYVNLLVSCRRGSYFDDSVQNLLPNSAAIYAVGFFLHRYRVDENEKIAAAYHLVACDNSDPRHPWELKWNSDDAKGFQKGIERIPKESLRIPRNS